MTIFVRDSGKKDELSSLQQFGPPVTATKPASLSFNSPMLQWEKFPVQVL